MTLKDLWMLYNVFWDSVRKVELGQRNAQKLGIRGVPYFVINEEISLFGLQSPDEFLKIFENN